MSSSPTTSLLLDPSLLEGLTPEERAEALAAAAAAKRAEERAEQRALERAIQKREQERLQEKVKVLEKSSGNGNNTSAEHKLSQNPKIQFVPKRKRLANDVNGAATDDSSNKDNKQEGRDIHAIVTQRQAAATKPTSHNNYRNRNLATTPSSTSAGGASSSWTDKERLAVRQAYLGSSITEVEKQQQQAQQQQNQKKKKQAPKSKSKKATFRFEWDDTDDTLDDRDPLYAGTSQLQQQQHHHKHPQQGHHNYRNRQPSQQQQQQPQRKKSRLLPTDKLLEEEETSSSSTGNIMSRFHNKPLEQMTMRDWRIFRENYQIVVKGGRAPPPLRRFQEANLEPQLLNALFHTLHYQEPTPIQRQAIPIGLQRRDLIGIAETGSGKTCAFGVPLLQYILQLPSHIQNRVADQGPLALVVAPTRELALQIHGEFQKMLSRQSNIKSCVIVGGQSIQHQAQELRDGVHVVVGTPGRINDCIDMAYMVLNQCCYIVLDEADRMIDMGFAPQMEGILDAMGGALKSENEQEAYQQEEEDRQALKQDLPRHRVTAMFSATMPMEVERMAQRYLRHPAVISIGDQDSGKNARIIQKIIYLSSPKAKEKALRDLLSSSSQQHHSNNNNRYHHNNRGGPPREEKIIVFVNEKKHADGVGRMVERMGRPCVVLHGGKSQEQREAHLAQFRQGGGVVLVATDVAGRGLDISNVTHVINYDLPTRSIDNYCHRIGRTGRAGKEGMATSFMTDEDQGIMAPLKAYLESTGMPVPDKLARHPAATANNQGNLIY